MKKKPSLFAVPKNEEKEIGGGEKTSFPFCAAPHVYFWGQKERENSMMKFLLGSSELGPPFLLALTISDSSWSLFQQHLLQRREKIKKK